MRTRLGADAASGKDCLRLAKSESMAKLLFRRRLAAAREGREPARARGSHAGAQARPL